MKNNGEEMKNLQKIGGFAALYLAAGYIMGMIGFLGVVVGVAGIISIVPAFGELFIYIFALGQIVWFIWLGIVLLRNNPSQAV